MGVGAGTPKSVGRDIAIYAAGAAVKVADGLLSDVLFLDKHPSWSWSDLMNTPDEVVRAMRLLDQERAKQA